MAQPLQEVVKRLRNIEIAIDRLGTRENGSGGGGGTVVPHPLPVSGGWHTGLLPWGDLSKTGSNLADLATRMYTSLTDRTHDITGADHAIFGNKWDIVGATDDGVLGLITPSSVASGPIYEHILKTDGAGALELVTLTATTEVVTNQLRGAGALSILNAGVLNDIIITPARHLVLEYNRRFQSNGANLIGYLGNGFGIWTDAVSGKAKMETDELTVRGRMNVYELVIRQIRSTNGNLLVTSASKTATVTLLTGVSGAPGSTYTMTVEDNTYHGFFPDDLIKAQRWRFDGAVGVPGKATIFIAEMTVLTTPTLTTYTARLDDGDAPQAGWDFVRHGNRTDVDRQGMIGIMADDTNSPFIAIVNGVDDWTDWFSGTKLKGLVGNLTGSAIGGLPDPVTGYEYGMVFGTGWTSADSYVKISNRVALFNKINAHWYNGLLETVRIEAAGNMIMGKDISFPANTSFTFTASTGILALGRSDTPAITFNGTTGASYFTGIMTLANTAEIRQGVSSAGNVQTDAFASLTNYTGFRLWSVNAFTGQVGTMAGYNTGVVQWSADVNGRFLVGNVTNAGLTTATADAILSTRGVTLKSVTGASSANDTLAGTSRGIRWYGDPVVDTNPVASILAGNDSGGFPFMTLNLRTGGGNVASLGLYQAGGVVQAWFDGIDTVVGIPTFFATNSPGGGFDAAAAFGVNGSSSDDLFEIRDNVFTSINTDWLPTVSDTWDLGTPGLRWNNVYVKTITADTITGTIALGGQTWQYNTGDMYIISTFAADRTLYIANNNPSYRMDLNVEGDIIVGPGRTVDGVDMSAFYSAFGATSIIAGQGLTGGGTLGGPVTLDVGAGTMITVGGNTVGITDAPGADYLMGSGTDATANWMDMALLAGPGLGLASNAFQVGAGTLIAVGTNTVGLATGAAYQFIGTGNDTVAEYINLSTLKGNGLTYATGVLTVGAGTLIDVQTNTVGIATGAAYQFIGTGSDTVAEYINLSTLKGNGLTYATGTLTVGAGTMITVGTNTVGITDAPSTYYLIGSGSGAAAAWFAMADMAGNGLEFESADDGYFHLGTPSTLSVSSTNLVTADSHTHAITTSSNPGANARILATTAGGALTVEYLTANQSVATNTLESNGSGLVYVYASMQVNTNLTVDGTSTLTGAVYANTSVRTPLITATSGLTISTGTTITLNPFSAVILPDTKILQSASFASGFGGHGFYLAQDGLLYPGQSYLEVDNLTVRGLMNVYELVIQKIRSTNGNLFVTSSFKVVAVTGAGPYVITAEPESGNNFAVHDVIRAQRWTNGASVMQSNMTVLSVSGLDATVQLDSGDPPEVGFEYVRLGNGVTAARQGTLYLAADDVGAPFIDVKAGVTSAISWSAASTTKMRMGKLDGITNFYFGGVDEYGFIAGGGVSGFATSMPWIRVSNLGVQMNNIPITMWNGGVNTGTWEANGSLYASNTSVTVANDRVFWMDTTTGNLRVGKIGTVPSPLANLTWTAAGVLALNSNTTAMVSLTAAGVVTVGPVANSRSRIVLDSDPSTGGVRLIWRNGSGLDAERVALLNNGNVNISGNLNVTALTTLTGNVTLNSNLTVNTGTIEWAGVGEMNSNGIRITTAAASSIALIRTYGLLDPSGNMMTWWGGYKNGTATHSSLTHFNAVAGTATFSVLVQPSNGLATLYLTALGSTGTSSITLTDTLISLSASGGIVNAGQTVLANYFAGGGVGSAANPVFRYSTSSTGMFFTGSSGIAFSAAATQVGTITAGGYTSSVAGAEGAAAIGFANGAGLYYSLSRLTLTSATDWVMVADIKQAIFQNGTTLLPSLAFASSFSTGIYYHSANTIGFSTNGTLAMSINGSNNLSVNGIVAAATSMQAGTTITAGTYFTGSIGGFANPAYRFATPGLTGMFGSSLYLGLELEGTDIMIARLDANTSYLKLGNGNANNAAAALYLYTNGALATTVTAHFQRAAGPNGNLQIYNGGTGVMEFLVGASSQWIDTAGNFAGVNSVLVENGSAAAPGFRFTSSSSSGLYYSGGVYMSVLNATRMLWGSVGTVSYQPFWNDYGTLAAPGITWDGDTDCGFYHVSNDSFAAVATSRLIATFSLTVARPILAVNSGDCGAGAAGPAMLVGYNSNASNGAGFLGLTNRAAIQYRFWVSNANVFRFNTADPTQANDNAGTAIITFASSRAVKDILGDPDAPLTVMDHLRVGAASVMRFAYKPFSDGGERPYEGDDFSGIIIDDAPRYAMDSGKALNVFTAIGDLMIGTNHLHDRIRNLEEEVATLKQQVSVLQGA